MLTITKLLNWSNYLNLLEKSKFTHRLIKIKSGQLSLVLVKTNHLMRSRGSLDSHRLSHKLEEMIKISLANQWYNNRTWVACTWDQTMNSLNALLVQDMTQCSLTWKSQVQSSKVSTNGWSDKLHIKTEIRKYISFL